MRRRGPPNCRFFLDWKDQDFSEWSGHDDALRSVLSELMETGSLAAGMGGEAEPPQEIHLPSGYLSPSKGRGVPRHQSGRLSEVTFS